MVSYFNSNFNIERFGFIVCAFRIVEIERPTLPISLRYGQESD